MKYFFLPVILFAASLAHAARWDGYNHPANMDVDDSFIYKFEQMPMRMELKTLPWSETYWPTFKGSINYRWFAEEPDGFYYTPYTKEEIKRLSFEAMKELSPSEKYDLYMGRYDYPLYREAQSFGNPRAPDWHGICDGWSTAALQFPEPKPVTLVNPDGILIPFGSSDIKGLLSYYTAIHFKPDTGQSGTSCENRSGCYDINPGAMHVILGNVMGIQKKGFVTEKDPGYEIWNQPTFGYTFKYLGSAHPEEGYRGVRVHTNLYYTDELESSQWEAVVGTPEFKWKKLELDYVVEIDQYGDIIGGYWLGRVHPDFMWIPKQTVTFTGAFEGINQILKASYAQPVVSEPSGPIIIAD